MRSVVMPTTDLDRCVMHAGSDTIHKLRYAKLEYRENVLNRTRTECGHLTTHMHDISAEKVKEIAISHRCKKCFD